MPPFCVTLPAQYDRIQRLRVGIFWESNYAGPSVVLEDQLDLVAFGTLHSLLLSRYLL